MSGCGRLSWPVFPSVNATLLQSVENLHAVRLFVLNLPHFVLKMESMIFAQLAAIMS